MAGSFVRRRAAGGGASAASKPGPNGTLLVSTGLANLDKVVGGGIPIGRIVIVMEDTEAPHHLLLLRYFMAQGVSHGQPILFGSPLASPKAFLGTLPAVVAKRKDEMIAETREEAEGLRIAWQYRKYERQEQAPPQSELRASEACDYTSSFDLRRACDRATLNASRVECYSFQGAKLDSLLNQCRGFVANLSPAQVGRIALHSLCAPQCMESCSEWEMLSFLLYVKALLQNANAVAIVTLPASLLSPSFSERCQHLADILLYVRALPDDDQSKEAAFLDYREMVGLVHVHKLPTLNTQVPAISATVSYGIKVVKKRDVVLEPLHLAPVGAQPAAPTACNTAY